MSDFVFLCFLCIFLSFLQATFFEYLYPKDVPERFWGPIIENKDFLVERAGGASNEIALWFLNIFNASASANIKGV